jgi:hypothetical protein
VSAVAVAAGCEEDCRTATTSALCYISPAGERAECPVGCQALIDKMYFKCGGCELEGEDFDEQNAVLKTMIERGGCAGAAQSTPAIFIIAAVVIGHYLS